MLDQVYAAIADPTRRAILGILAEGEINVGSLAERFPISLNGVSKHVKVLERAGLVERTIRGREHRLRLNAQPLREASMWLEHYRTFWDARLAALEAYLLTQARDAGSAQTQPLGRMLDDGTDEAGPVLVVRREIAVPRERVFEAWLDSESLAHWMRPGDFSHATVTVDPRVGGGFRIVMEGRTDGGASSIAASTWPSSRRRCCRSPGSPGHRPQADRRHHRVSRAGRRDRAGAHPPALPPKAVEGHRGGWTDIVRLLDETLTRR